jgi:hypothetical protein
MSKVVVVETRKQHVGVGVTQSFGGGITTIGVEMVVAPNINVVRRGVQIGFATKLGNRLSGVSEVRNLSRSLALPVVTTGVASIPQMVFTNPITTTHVNMITDRPLMNSMHARGYKSTYAMHPRGGY